MAGHATAAVAADRRIGYARHTFAEALMPQLTGVLVAAALLLSPQFAAACGAIAQAPRIIRASLLAEAEAALTITFLGHASFLIETPGHVTAVTDYNGVNIPVAPPDIATMNHAHPTHYTDHPDPRIRHVLRGWRDDGGPAHIDLTDGDLHVRNLPTNIREWGGSGTGYYGNSIFIFESAGLCVAHLSHLHHLLTADDLSEIGPIDVVMAPVDGIYTLSHEDMATVLDEMHPRLVLPMHYFSEQILQRFLDLVRDRYEVVIGKTPTTTIARATLPARPEILVLPGSYY
jgi:L-ascorbate metabolism protein UlaG (beta-lactamase superfamily)